MQTLSVSITEEQKEWIQKQGRTFNTSKFVREQLQQHIEQQRGEN